MEAICASLIDCANAAVENANRTVANSVVVFMHVGCTRMAGRSRLPATSFQLEKNGGDDAIAARAVEAVHAAAGGVDVALERFTQQRAGAEEARTDGGFGNSERVGRFARGHLFDLAHHEHG